MVPDSYKTPEMLTSELKAKIVDEEARMERSQSGVNEYYGLESSGQADSAKNIKAYRAQLAEVEAEVESQKLSKNGAGGTVYVAGDSSKTTQNYGGDTIILGPAPQIGGGRPDRPSL